MMVMIEEYCVMVDDFVVFMVGGDEWFMCEFMKWMMVVFVVMDYEVVVWYCDKLIVIEVVFGKSVFVFFSDEDVDFFGIVEDEFVVVV